MVHRPNPVQTIAQHRHQFGQRQPGPPPQFAVGQQQPEHAIQESMQELAQEIYARLVVGKLLASDSYTAGVDQEQMQELAKTA